MWVGDKKCEEICEEKNPYSSPRLDRLRKPEERAALSNLSMPPPPPTPPPPRTAAFFFSIASLLLMTLSFPSPLLQLSAPPRNLKNPSPPQTQQQKNKQTKQNRPNNKQQQQFRKQQQKGMEGHGRGLSSSKP
jgi:hypothetical protein